jgi:hypothetical protein
MSSMDKPNQTRTSKTQLIGVSVLSALLSLTAGYSVDRTVNSSDDKLHKIESSIILLKGEINRIENRLGDIELENTKLKREILDIKIEIERKNGKR